MPRHYVSLRFLNFPIMFPYRFPLMRIAKEVAT